MQKLIFTVDRLEEDKAVLINEIAKINLPIDKLPNNTAEGDRLFVIISKEDLSASNSKTSAKDVLNEILNND